MIRQIDFATASHLSNLKMLVTATALLTSFGANALFAHEAGAQGTQPTHRQTCQPTRPSRSLKNTENPEFKSQRLTKAVEMSDVPAYKGKGVEFVTGTMFPNVKGGPSVTMQLSCRDEPAAVLQWYKDALVQNKWSLLDNMSGKTGLAAMKSNNIFQVMTIGASKPGSRCDLVVRYKSYKATDFSSN